MKMRGMTEDDACVMKKTMTRKKKRTRMNKRMMRRRKKTAMRTRMKRKRMKMQRKMTKRTTRRMKRVRKARTHPHARHPDHACVLPGASVVCLRRSLHVCVAQASECRSSLMTLITTANHAQAESKPQWTRLF